MFSPRKPNNYLALFTAACQSKLIRLPFGGQARKDAAGGRPIVPVTRSTQIFWQPTARETACKADGGTGHCRSAFYHRDAAQMPSVFDFSTGDRRHLRSQSADHTQGLTNRFRNTCHRTFRKCFDLRSDGN